MNFERILDYNLDWKWSASDDWWLNGGQELITKGLAPTTNKKILKETSPQQLIRNKKPKPKPKPNHNSIQFNSNHSSIHSTQPATIEKMQAPAMLPQQLVGNADAMVGPHFTAHIIVLIHPWHSLIHPFFHSLLGRAKPVNYHQQSHSIECWSQNHTFISSYSPTQSICQTWIGLGLHSYWSGHWFATSHVHSLQRNCENQRNLVPCSRK